MSSFFKRFDYKALYFAAMPFLILVLSVSFANGQNNVQPEATFTNSSPITLVDATGTGTNPIPSNANPYPSTITVSGLTGTIPTTPGSIKVTLNGFSHTYPDDIDMILVGPTGAAFRFQSGATDGTQSTGQPASNLTYSVSDAGSSQLPDSSALAAQTYKPAAYYGADPFPAPGPGSNFVSAAPTGSGTFASVFGGTNPNGDWKLFIRDYLPGDSGNISGGWTLEINTGGGTTATFDNRLDYFGNGFSDWAILTSLAPDYLVWKIARNDNPTPSAPGAARIDQIPHGSVTLDFEPSGLPAFGDYTGDGRADFVTWRTGSQGYYLIRRSENNGTTYTPWGGTGFLPGAEGDYDGDNKMDPTVITEEGAAYRWYILRSNSNTFDTFTFGSTSQSRPFDIPLAGADYTGDGLDDPAVARVQTNGDIQWIIGNNTGNVIRAETWGNYNTDYITPAGDYDGDGKADLAVWRGFGSFTNNVGVWAVRKSSGGDMYEGFGASGSGDTNPNRDIPLRSGDYDGDKKTDFAVWRPSNETFYVLRSSNRTLLQQPWGGGIPIARFGVY